MEKKLSTYVLYYQKTIVVALLTVLTTIIYGEVALLVAPTITIFFFMDTHDIPRELIVGSKVMLWLKNHNTILATFYVVSILLGMVYLFHKI